MKYIKDYNGIELRIDRMSVRDMVDEIGNENTAKYLTTLLKGKYCLFNLSMVAKTDYHQPNTNSGTVNRIFYVDTSGFIIARINDDTYSDLIINSSVIECDEELDYESALMVLNIDKYNI